MPILKLYKDKNIDCKMDLVSIEDYLIKMMNTELNARLENCQIIWIATEIFKSEYKKHYLENSSSWITHEKLASNNNNFQTTLKTL